MAGVGTDNLTIAQSEAGRGVVQSRESQGLTGQVACEPEQASASLTGIQVKDRLEPNNRTIEGGQSESVRELLIPTHSNNQDAPKMHSARLKPGLYPLSPYSIYPCSRSLAWTWTF